MRTINVRASYSALGSAAAAPTPRAATAAPLSSVTPRGDDLYSITSYEGPHQMASRRRHTSIMTRLSSPMARSFCWRGSVKGRRQLS